jgi:purine-binding chemotaxis protein CheW
VGAQSQLERFVVFQVGDDRYACPLENVAEISRIPTITPVPRTPDFVVGVANLRGNVVSILDLKPLLGIPEDEDKPLSAYRMLIITHEQLSAAFVVDRVEGVVAISESDLEPPLPGAPEAVRPWISGHFRYEDSLIGTVDPALVAGLRELLEQPSF